MTHELGRVVGVGVEDALAGATVLSHVNKALREVPAGQTPIAAAVISMKKFFSRTLRILTDAVSVGEGGTMVVVNLQYWPRIDEKYISTNVYFT